MPTNKIQFGWCMPHSTAHMHCVERFTYDNKEYVCPCECHPVSETTSDTASTAATPAVDDGDSKPKAKPRAKAKAK